MALYGEGGEEDQRCRNQPEFIAYRFLYLILTSNTAGTYTTSTRGMEFLNHAAWLATVAF